MIDFPERVSREEILLTLRDLRRANCRLGGTRACLKAIQPLVEEIAGREKAKRPIRVADFGSGSADIPEALVRWATSKSYSLQVTAIDFNFMTCQVASAQVRRIPEIAVVQGDVLRPPVRESAFDIVLCSAFLHHFSEDEIASILESFRRLARRAIVVSDLHRHRVAYAAIWLLTRLLSRSAAVRNDGPLSVLKGFRRDDLVRILNKAGFEGAMIRRRWAYRHVVVIPIS